MATSGSRQHIGIAAVIAASCATSLWVVMAELPHTPDEVKATAVSVKTKPPDGKAIGKQAIASIWNTDVLSARFQGPPKPEEPVKPVQAVAPVAVLPTLPFQLTGTILEDDARFAVLRDNSGKEFVVREGENIPAPHEAIVVKSVQERFARFGISGTEQELTLKTPNFDLLFQ